MNVRYHSNKRSDLQEIMDDFSFGGDEMRSLLKDLRFVNRWLGGNSTTIKGILKLIAKRDLGKLRILDVGCGDGEFLRVCADKLRSKGINAEFVGIDANLNIIEQARDISVDYENINFIHADVFEYDFKNTEFDIALCTLFLHHFDNEGVERILKTLTDSAKVGVVINDLQRSRLAFVLFKFVSILLLRSRIARIDGLISIARAFKRSELSKFEANLNLNGSIKWKWAFRYLWIIKTQYER